MLINDINLSYRVDAPPGYAPPAGTLILLHSLGCDLRIWEPVLPTFLRRWRILRYDLRGHGLSESPPGPYTIRQNSQDLAGLMDRLNIEMPIIVGISLGGLVAMDFALQHPGRVRGLALCDTAPRIGSPQVWEERIQAVNERGLAAMCDTILSRWFAPGFAESHTAEYSLCQDILAHTSQAGYVAACAALRDADLRESLGQITAPVLAMCGEHDLVVTPEQTREWAACLPTARVAIVPGAAHLPCIEQPQVLGEALDRFFKEECGDG